MILYGASGHAKVIADILKATGIEITELFDDNDQIKTLSGINVVKPHQTEEELIISIGNNAIRKKIVETNNFRYGIAIHPTAIVSPSAVIGEGTVVMQGAIIQADAVIGKHCIINTGATVDHECKIEDYVHISPNSSLCGNVKVGAGTWIGAGTTVIPGIEIGSWSTIGAGSTVINNINSNMVAVGCPCKIIRNDMKINGLRGGVRNPFLLSCITIKTIDYAA
jgi:sugar O-acyltransferase (sialic acid O-acetyltransferase NeuD family)